MTDALPQTLTCPACGAPLDFDGKSSIVRCKFCNNVSIVPGFQPVQDATSRMSLDQILQLAKDGNLLEAIKHYGEIYNVDLAEAKQAVEALQAGRLAETPDASAGSPAPEEMTRMLEEVKHLLNSGNKLEAIKRYRETNDIGLARAKYAVEQIEAGRTSWFEAGFPAPAREAHPAKKARWVGWLPLIIILFTAGILTFALLQRGGPLSPHLNVNGPAILISSAQDAPPDVAAMLYNSNKETRQLGLVEATKGNLLWKAEPLPGDGYVDALAQSDEMIYAASGTDLLAYKIADGSLAWQATMPDKLYSSQDDLLVSNGRVITLTLDQSLQAYDAASGAQVWSRRMAGYDRTLRMVGNSLLILDYIGDTYDYSLVFLDPSDGSQQRVLTPTCQYDEYSSATLDTDSGIVYDEGENALYLVFDSSYGCVQRLDLASGQVAWQALSKDSFSFAMDGFNFLMTDTRLYFSEGNQLVMVDKAAGTMGTLVTNADYEFLPLALSGDRLLLRARRTRGTERFELWGVEATSGEQLWQKTLEGASPLDPPNEMVGLVDDTDSGWTWRLVPAGLMLLRFQAAPNQLVVETMNPVDGTSLGEKSIALKKVTGDFYSIPTILGWQGDVVYMVVETNIYAIDTTTGVVKFSY